MRIRGFPFDESVEAFLAEHEFCFVVEQNRDAQLPLAADARNQRAEGEAALGAGLRRLPAERAST